MKNGYRLSTLALTFLSASMMWCSSAWAEHVDPVPLPDAVIKAMQYRSTSHPSLDQARMSMIARLLEHHIEESRKIAEELDATQKLTGDAKENAWLEKRTLVAAKQNELAVLRKEALDQ
ncbi:MAG TPA: hypothetical protein VIF82_17865, partial [Burkholderiaceae bacterium]